ncbi:MAG: FkbM family methyltransferase [Bacteroidota bacterium]
MIKKQQLINISRFIRNYLAIYFPKTFKKFDFRAFNQQDQAAADFKSYAEPELFFINELLEPGSTLIDIGSNAGVYLYIFQKAKKYKRIIGFEPIPILFKRLRKYFPDLEIFDYAVSDKSETGIFKIPYIDGRIYDTRGTLHNYTEEGETKSDRISVKKITLDDFIADHNIEEVSFIKIDIEGHEIAAIDGAKNTICKFMPLLLIEIEQRHHPETNIDVLFSLITKYNYQGFFFDKADQRFKPLSDFSAAIHQNLSKMNEYYINNFIFVSDSNFVSITNKFKLIENILRNQETIDLQNDRMHP